MVVVAYERPRWSAEVTLVAISGCTKKMKIHASSQFWSSKLKVVYCNALHYNASHPSSYRTRHIANVLACVRVNGSGQARMA